MSREYSERGLLKSLGSQLGVFAVMFFAVPLPAVLKINTDLSYLVNMLLIINPAVCFIMNIAYCLKNRFLWFVPLICAAMFAPTIPIYYNATAAPYLIFYTVLAYIGAAVGVSINRNQKKDDEDNGDKP